MRIELDAWRSYHAHVIARCSAFEGSLNVGLAR
jgi:hypothetical protein